MPDPKNGGEALAAGGIAAILASTCCLGPLVPVALGFSGAWIGNLVLLEAVPANLHRGCLARSVLRLAPHLPASARLQTR
jgi:hypothetical protein